MIVLFLPLAFAPALFWMWWYYRQDVYEKEPKGLLILVFLLAMPMSVFTGLFEYTLDGGRGNLSSNSNFLVSSLFYLLIVGVVEELAKFSVVVTVAYTHVEFNEPVDGIIYAVAAALGFGSFENIFYLLDQGPMIILLRGPVSTLGHVLFSAMWGAALGLARFENERGLRYRRIGRGLVWAVLTHALFDILISLSHFQEWLSLSAILFLVAMYYAVSRRIAYALDLSQFKPNNPIQLLQKLGKSSYQRIQKVRAARASHEPIYIPNPHSYHFNRPAPPEQNEANPTLPDYTPPPADD